MLPHKTISNIDYFTGSLSIVFFCENEYYGAAILIGVVMACVIMGAREAMTWGQDKGG